MQCKLEKANKLNSQIQELNNFIHTISPITGDDERNYVMLNIKIKKELSLFGSRYYGIGRSESSLKVPSSIASLTDAIT